ncbi:MAG: DUF4013 domain-containing protein [Pirellulaceae bacterium]
MSQATVGYSTFKSSPVRAFKTVFASPNWVTNVLWMTIGAIVPFVGIMGLLGWGTYQLRYRSGRPENQVPDIDSSQLGDYVTKGIWPFCAYFIVQMVGSMILMVPMMIFMFGSMAAFGENGIPLVVLGFFPLILLVTLALAMMTTPVVLRAMVSQDLGESLNFAWVRQFAGIMFWEMLVSGIVFYFLSLGVLLLGAAMCGIGYIPAIGIITGASINLLAQWYEIFLDRGGEPAPEPKDQVIDATIV